MKKKTKQKVILSAALALLLWGGVGENSAFAAYKDPGTYKTTVDGNGTGEKRMTSTGGSYNSYHFFNIKQNQSDLIKGGAFYLNSEGYNSFSFRNSLLEENHGSIGGAMYIGNAAMGAVLNNTGFFSNTADTDAGALYTLSSIDISNIRFENNRAISGRGGAIYFAPDGNDIVGMSMITNSDFINNSSGKEGGAIYVNDTTSGAELYLKYNDNQTHYMTGNVQNTDGTNGAQSSNAIFIEEGNVRFLTSGKDSKVVIDGSIEGNPDKINKARLEYTTSNDGTVVFNGEIKNLTFTHDAGTLLLNHGDKIPDGVPIFNNVDLLIKPGQGSWQGDSDLRFDLANGKLDTLIIRNLTVLEPKDDRKMVIALDVDLNQGKSDFFNVTGSTTGTLKFDTDHFELNILDTGDADSFQMFNGVPSDFLTGELVQITDNGTYILKAGENGLINVTKEDESGLYEAVISDKPIREYVASNNIKISKNLLPLGGESLTVNMKGYSLNGSKLQGITVNEGQRLEIKNAGGNDGSVHNFSTKGNGAVVNNVGGAVTVTDSTISNNATDGKGGAIYSKGGTVTLNASTKNVVFKENYHQLAPQPVNPDEAGNTKAAAGVKNDIYLEQATLNVNGSNNTVIESGIAGDGTIVKNDAGTLKLAGDNSAYTGDVQYKGGAVELQSGAKYFSAQNTTFSNNAKLNLVNGSTDDRINFGNLTLESDAKIDIDANFAKGTSDKIGAESVSGSGKVVIDNVNIIDPATKANAEFSVITLDENGDSALLGKVEMAGGNSNVAYSPIYKYKTEFNPDTGVISMSGGGKTSKGYNPAVLASPVATLIGGYLTQLNSYDMAFNNTDSYMLLTEKERRALKYGNKYALLEGSKTRNTFITPYDDGNTWFKPYSNFERVRLQRGPRVTNMSYGSFFGHDSKMKTISETAQSMWSVYGGYNGSHQRYSGQGIYQNGGMLGATRVVYKRNGYIGTTVNAGANAAKANTGYGDEDFAMFMAGVAMKMGYNGEFFDSRITIQPNYMMSYSFVNAFDYTNSAGVRLQTKPLNAIQFRPGLRIVGNCPKGWRPYVSASIVWNVLDEAAFKANDVSLPELSIKPYVNYGIGFQKSGERLGGFFETMLRSGGREGISLQAGLNIAM